MINVPPMETKKTVKVFAALASITGLSVVLLVLWRCLGLSKTFFFLAGAISVVILAIFLWILVRYISLDYRNKLNINQLTLEELRNEYSFLRRVAGLPTKFPFEVLIAATDNFSTPIGRGSTASVFKGILDDGTPVAVKQINVERAGDSGDYFRAEISVISSVQHANLVRLLGYCFLPRGGCHYLVYEYIANGSLDSWIFPRMGRDRCLPWHVRYRVAINVAKGLAYLHHDSRVRVLHLDVKPENILLSESFRAVVSDFGLWKLMKKDESRVIMKVRGTRGYLAPEWLLQEGVSEKSDVYSYGMVLFELIGGRRNAVLVEADDDEERRKLSYFPRIVAEKAREGRVMEVVDRRIVEEAEEKQVRTMVGVALWCVQEAARLRPSMARVVDMLEGRMGVDMPPETDMIIVDMFSMDDIEPIGGGGDLGDRQDACSGPLVTAVQSEIGESGRSVASSVLSGR